jgi:2-octaprenyl-6-methoxyphenol hydroxylase
MSERERGGPDGGWRRAGVARPRIAVVGAGPAGLAAALALARAGCAVTLLDARPLPAPGAPLPEEGRTVALLQPAIDLLDRLGIWRELEAESAPLRALRLVSLARDEAEPEADVTFEASEIGLAEFGRNLRIGRLRALLLDALREAGAELVDDAAVEDVVRERDRLLIVHGRGTLRVDLVVAADGRRSAVRRALRIAARERPTGRVAIGTSFAHSRPHGDVSIELHRPGGAFTMVPLPGDRSSLVWVEPAAEAKRLLGLSEDGFRAELERRVRPWLGEVGEVGRRDGYPLVGSVADRLAAPRAVLLGEAAHALSPVGAQGLNTSLRDVAVLAERVERALERGIPPWSAEVLLTYERARLADVRARFAVTEGLAAAVASDLGPVRFARTLGLRLLGSLPPLKAFVMRGLMRPMALPLLVPLP